MCSGFSHRLGWVKGKNPVQVEQELMKALPKDHWNRINFQLIYHGRAVCRARRRTALPAD